MRARAGWTEERGCKPHAVAREVEALLGHALWRVDAGSIDWGVRDRVYGKVLVFHLGFP
jgi:hypothetical protein